MLPRPLLALLPWLLAALSETAAQTVAAPAASEADTAPSKAGRLLGEDGFGGHLFLAWGRGPEWENGYVGRASLLLGWNPTFAGFSSRLAVASAFERFLSPPPESPHSRNTRVTYGLDEAWLRYPLDAFAWKVGLQAGWFRWRSHADAALAGEYLTRWKPSSYIAAPVRPETPWEALDSLTTVQTGLRLWLNSPGLRLRQEAMLLLDTLEPQPALSLLWSLNLSPLRGIEAGFSVRLDRLLETEGLHSPSQPNRNYDPRDTLPYTGPVSTVDSSGVSYYKIESRSFAARLTVDPMSLFTGKSRPDRGGRFYLETALLGWEKVFWYHDPPTRRLHFNAGLYLPAFGFLDVLRLQAELWPEPQGMNGLYGISRGPSPVPISSGGDSTGSYTSPPAESSHGWSGQLYLSRAVFPWLDVQGRAMLGRRWGYAGRMLLTPGPVQMETGTTTSFELRIVARL